MSPIVLPGVSAQPHSGLAFEGLQFGLDAEAFRDALGSGRYTGMHQRASQRAEKLDIRAVRTFLVGAHRIEGTTSSEQLAHLFDG